MLLPFMTGALDVDVSRDSRTLGDFCVKPSTQLMRECSLLIPDDLIHYVANARVQRPLAGWRDLLW